MFKLANFEILRSKREIKFNLTTTPDVKINSGPSVKQDSSRIIEQLAADENKTRIKDLFDDE
jgi:hypothetical protein